MTGTGGVAGYPMRTRVGTRLGRGTWTGVAGIALATCGLPFAGRFTGP